MNCHDKGLILEGLNSTVSISGVNINLSSAFYDMLLAHDGNISLYNAGIRGQGTATGHCKRHDRHE